MKKLELTLIGGALLAIVFFILRLPFAGLLLAVSFSSLSIFYMFFGFTIFNNIPFRDAIKKKASQNENTKGIIGGIVAGFALSAAAIAVLYKFMTWPNATVLIQVALAYLVVVLLISLYKKRKSKDTYYSNILKRIVFFMAFCVFFVVIPTQTWMSWKYPNNPEYVKAFLNARADSDNEELWEIVDKEREKMHQENYKEK